MCLTYFSQTLTNEDKYGLNLPQIPKNGPYGSLVWPSKKLRMVGDETKFTCAVCEMARRVNVVSEALYPPHDHSVFEYDIELVSYHRINEIGLVANGSDLTNRLVMANKHSLV
jgi:hypothetical protein